jgi:hypothetical protein
MVSWFRFYSELWSVFCAENAPDGHVLATQAHKALFSVEDTDELSQWFQTYGKVPGVFLVARNKVGRDGKRKVDVVHHLRLIPRSSEDGDEVLVGILQLGGGSYMSGFLVRDVMTELVPVSTGKRSGTRGGSSGDPAVYIPSLEGLMGNHDESFGKHYVPKDGEECLTQEDLAERPSIVFIPFYLWLAICRRTSLHHVDFAVEKVKRVLEMEDSEGGAKPSDEASLKRAKEEDTVWTDQANSPLVLARELAAAMVFLEANDANLFEVYHIVARNLLDFLWAANNNLTPGIRIRSTDGNTAVMRHTKECLQDFLTFAEVGTLPGWRKHQQPPPAPEQEPNPLFLVDTNRHEEKEEQKPRVLPPFPKGEKSRPPGIPPSDMITPQEESMAWVQSLMSGLAGTVADVGIAIREAIQVNRVSKDKEEEKKKATSKWLPDVMFVMKVLSAENGWATPGVPELNQFAAKLFEMKLLQAIQFVRAKARDDGWSGCILKSGLSEFLKRGPVAEDVHEAPSGFSVLFFHHSAYSEGDDESHSMQALREAYGDGELPDDLVKAFSKLHIFVPTCSFRAGEQIRAAVQFLEAVCGENTIATAGYKHGLRLLEEHRRLFEREADRDKMFLFNYLYLLDRMFQRFCREIRECKDEQDPVLALKDSIKGDRWMKEMINQALEPLVVYGKELGLRPPIKLQDRSSLSGLIDMTHSGSRGNPTNKRPAENQDGGGRTTGKAARRKVGAGDAQHEWWYELSGDEVVPEWAIPHGKKFGDYFGPHKKENVAGLPYVLHHKTKRPAPICLKYQLGNGVKCKRGADCALAHIRPRELTSEEYQQITDHLKKVFRTEAGQS